MNYPRVEVVWNDAHGGGDQQEDPALVEHRPYVITTMGRLIRDDEVGITLAGEVLEESGEIRNRTFIPRGMVVEVVRLRVDRKKPNAVGPRRSRTSGKSSSSRSGQSGPSQPAETVVTLSE